MMRDRWGSQELGIAIGGNGLQIMLSFIWNFSSYRIRISTKQCREMKAIQSGHMTSEVTKAPELFTVNR